jgi:hypothetical protein
MSHTFLVRIFDTRGSKLSEVSEDLLRLKHAADCYISEEPTNLLVNFNILDTNFLCIKLTHIELYNNGFGIFFS